jgi:hypothetical protein
VQNSISIGQRILVRRVPENCVFALENKVVNNARLSAMVPAREEQTIGTSAYLPGMRIAPMDCSCITCSICVSQLDWVA